MQVQCFKWEALICGKRHWRSISIWIYGRTACGLRYKLTESLKSPWRLMLRAWITGVLTLINGWYKYRLTQGWLRYFDFNTSCLAGVELGCTLMCLLWMSQLGLPWISIGCWPEPFHVHLSHFQTPNHIIFQASLWGFSQVTPIKDSSSHIVHFMCNLSQSILGCSYQQSFCFLAVANKERGVHFPVVLSGEILCCVKLLSTCFFTKREGWNCSLMPFRCC